MANKRQGFKDLQEAKGSGKQFLLTPDMRIVEGLTPQEHERAVKDKKWLKKNCTEGRVFISEGKNTDAPNTEDREEYLYEQFYKTHIGLRKGADKWVKDRIGKQG